MRLDKLTIKAQEALSEAMDHASQEGRIEIGNDPDGDVIDQRFLLFRLGEATILHGLHDGRQRLLA